MNIVVLGRFPPPFDGQALATQRLAELLSDARSVDRVSTQPKGEKPRNQGRLAYRRLLHFLTLPVALRKKLPTAAGTVVLWPAVSPDFTGHMRDRVTVLPALKRFPTILAVVHRGNFDKLFLSKLTRASAASVMRRMSGYVFLTEDLSRRCEPWIPPEKRHVIPNTIDAAVHFDELEVEAMQEQRVNRTSMRLLFLSNMIRSKGYLDALDAVIVLAKRGMDVEMQFVGEWPNMEDRAYFEQCVIENGLESRVTHLGPVRDRRRVRDLYVRNDVLILPTYYENEAQPLVILEALNAGLPVISTRHAGIPEMISNGREGYLVTPRRPVEIADAVQNLSDARRWMDISIAARRRFTEKYSPARVRRQWEDLLRALTLTN